MPQQTINLGATGSGAGGDSARTAFEKAIANFAELYKAALPSTSAEKQAARDMFGLGTAATKAVQAGPNDATAGALMAVGAFGLGLRNPPSFPSLANLPGGGDSETISQIFNLTAAGLPIGDNLSGWVVNRAGRPCAFLFPNAQRLVMTRFDGAKWLNPVEFFSTGNILGTVSQSGGVPTGAIIERGSNANGEYVRYADGTQICWRDFAPISVAANAASAVIGWSYPAGFTAAPLMMPCATVNFSQHIDAALALCDNGPVHNQSSTRMILRNLSAAARDIGLRVVAIGRWY